MVQSCRGGERNAFNGHAWAIQRFQNADLVARPLRLVVRVVKLKSSEWKGIL